MLCQVKLLLTFSDITRHTVAVNTVLRKKTSFSKSVSQTDKERELLHAALRLESFRAMTVIKESQFKLSRSQFVFAQWLGVNQVTYLIPWLPLVG